MKRFQLMQRVNVEGLYGAVQEALPHLKRNGASGRIVVVCPPIYSRFFRGKTAYAMGKVGMRCVFFSFSFFLASGDVVCLFGRERWLTCLGRKCVGQGAGGGF